MHLSRSAALRLASFAVCLSSAAAAPAIAADLPAAPAAACELHVWPSGGVGVRTAGLGVGFGIIGAIADAKGHETGDRARTAAASNAFGPDKQLAVLAADDPASALHLASYRVVPHDKPLDPKAARTKLRHSDSASPCYAELITSSILYYKGAIYKGTLNVDFIYLKFGEKQKAASSYHDMIRHAPGLADARSADAIGEAADRFAELYSTSFKEFANHAVTQPDWK